MKHSQLISTYLTGSIQITALTYIQRNSHLDQELPPEVNDFFKKFTQEEKISDQDFYLFCRTLSKVDNLTKCIIIHLAFSLSSQIYDSYREEIELLVKDIEHKLKEEHPLLPNNLNSNKTYLGLINIYRLFAYNIPLAAGVVDRKYPGVDKLYRWQIGLDIPLAINVLILTGKLPKTHNYQEIIDLSKPCYPLHLSVTQQNKIPLQKGIKDSTLYYPFKKVSKLFAGATGDNTFIATNGTKVLFIRGVEQYAPHAIFTSKIACLVSAKHFSSERLLDNHLAAAKKLPSYVVSVSDEKTLDARRLYIEMDQRIFPGTGIIDEVTNFLSEQDDNPENFSYSSENIEAGFLSKIDFDQCNPFHKITKESYNQDILTNSWRIIYPKSLYLKIQNDPHYIQEKLYARLKLSMLTLPLFVTIANKAFSGEEQERPRQAISECTNRTNVALELFFEHPNVSNFLQDNPHILNQCYSEVNQYITSHFDDETIIKILQKSLSERVHSIYDDIEKKLHITLPEIQLSTINPKKRVYIPTTSIDGLKKEFSDTSLSINNTVSQAVKQLQTIEDLASRQTIIDESELKNSPMT